MLKRLGGPEAKKELDERIGSSKPHYYTKRLLDLVTEQDGVGTNGIYAVDNVGKGVDERFVLLDLGYGMETGEKGKTIFPSPRKYAREKR